MIAPALKNVPASAEVLVEGDYLTMLKFCGMTLVAAGMMYGQGAVHEGMSMYASKAYDGVEREMAGQDGGRMVIQRGMLTFDPRDQVKFVSEDGAELRIPYKAIKALDYSFYNPIQERHESSSKFVPKLHKIGGKRYLTVHYESAQGLQSTVMAFDPDRYQRVFGTFITKTGLMINRTGMEAEF
jgi:hypothetical protein